MNLSARTQLYKNSCLIAQLFRGVDDPEDPIEETNNGPEESQEEATSESNNKEDVPNDGEADPSDEEAAAADSKQKICN